MLGSLAIAPLVLAASAVQAVAQEDPINVTLLGPVLTPADLARQAVYDTPSPVPGVLPGSFQAGPQDVVNDRIALVRNSGPLVPVVANIDIDGTRDLYEYDCDQGRCQGFALDVSESLSRDVQQAYVSDIAAHLQAAVPGHARYRVTVAGGRMEGTPPQWKAHALSFCILFSHTSFAAGGCPWS
jgi:hypothetical protein